MRELVRLCCRYCRSGEGSVTSAAPVSAVPQYSAPCIVDLLGTLQETILEANLQVRKVLVVKDV